MKTSIVKLGGVFLLGAALFSGCTAGNEPETADIKPSVDMEYSNPQKGQKIYAKMFYSKCGITCEEMAKKHTQSQWEDFYMKGNVGDAIGEYCPIMDELNPKEQRLVYDFMYYHASDSGHVAACED